VVLTAIPDASCGDTQSIAKDLRRIAKTKRQALLGLVLVDAMLTPSARAAVLVPESVLSGNTNAHRVVHRRLIDDGKLQGIIRLPRVVVTAYPRQASLILLLGTESANDEVWAYDVTADGYSQDRRRRPLLSDNQLGPAPALALDAEAAARNELPDVVRQWHVWSRGEQLPAGARGTTIARSAIVAAGYRFDLDQLCRGVTDTGDQRKPHEVLAELTQLEAEIFEGLRDIVAALK
jgi:type I restriction enzyme M protein